MNRLRRFEMGYALLEEFLMFRDLAPCQHNATRKNIPDDMEIVEVRPLLFNRSFEIVVRSDSFEEILEGAMPPIWQPLYSSNKEVG